MASLTRQAAFAVLSCFFLAREAQADDLIAAALPLHVQGSVSYRY